MKPCATCSSTCCRLPFPLTVTDADIERLGPLAVHVLPLDQPTGAFVGQLPKQADGACIFLRDDGCTVHEVKPEVCRKFDPYDCGMFEPDPAKEQGRLRLRVLDPEPA